MLRISTISFPGIGIGEFSVNSVAFSIFGFDIAWYALLITFGMVCAVAYVIYESKKIGITSEDVLDYALFVIPIGIVGARLYYVLTELDKFHSIWEVFNIRGGGLAIYGGIIAGGITVLVVSYVKKINFLAFADCVAPGVLLAQGIGRWGNFMNGEAYGYECDWFCRMGLQSANTAMDFGTSEMVYVHPTFLYESLWNFLGVALVVLFAKYIKKQYDGQLFLMIFGWYGLGRMFIEGLRTDSLYIPGTELRISQVLAGIIFVCATAILIYFAIKKPNKPLYVKESKTKLISKKGKK
ncbi:MAG: prolipoprotein diacylglyceryl transferase [Clostridia bacterium]|nr:prolipoprotein diacylglyceryl transferase [Clostridia bacterium]